MTMMSWFNKYLGALRREIRHFTMYPTFRTLSIVLPLVGFGFFVLMFRTGIARDLPIAVLDGDNTTLSRKLERMIDATPSAAVKYEIGDMAEGERLMKEGRIDAIVYIPDQMEKNILRGEQTNVVCYINGLNLTKNGLLNKDIQATVKTFSSGIQVQMLMKKGLSEKQAYDQMMPIYFEKHILFNPYINYGYYLLPTFMPLILMIFTLLTTVFTIGVELKTRTAGEWMASAGGSMTAALAGKLTPYTVIFYVMWFFMFTVLHQYLGVPLEGSFGLLAAVGFLFVLCFQAIGVFFIALLANMRLSLSIGGGYSVLAFTFSGLTYPLMAMDGFVRGVSYIFPFTYYVEIFIDQALRGANTVYTLKYVGIMMLFLLLPLLIMRRLKRVCTDERYWSKL